MHMHSAFDAGACMQSLGRRGHEETCMHGQEGKTSTSSSKHIPTPACSMWVRAPTCIVQLGVQLQE